MTVRVRFAPSPTGGLHVGGARTALYNWLFARHNKGKFILRIEDTDRERSTDEFTQSILEGMKWLGMDWDEGPFYQSQRMDLYKQTIQKLLDEGKAYKCYCTPEEVQKHRDECMKTGAKPKYSGKCRNLKEEPNQSYSIRFKAPQSGTTAYHDFCRGKITFNNEELDDLIIARTDGSPTYNFTVVVDDVDMKITHIIRGDDHINNTPRQIIIYQALGYPIPEFVHLPMILGADKKKLSKRHGATFVMEYKDMGFLPDAMVNYLARLGWAHGDQEIFSVDEIINLFELEKVGNSSSVFDMEKFTWVNSQHIMKRNKKDLIELTKPFYKELGIDNIDDTQMLKVMNVMQERGRTLKEIAEKSTYFFKDEIDIDQGAKEKLINPDSIKALATFREKIAKIDSFSEESISAVFKELMDQTGLKMGKIAQPVRLAVTGITATPGIYEVFDILGKNIVLKRLDKIIRA